MSKKNILVIAPHPDDETLGVGGSIAKFASLGHYVYVIFVSGHLPPLYKNDDFLITQSEAERAMAILEVKDFIFLKIPATTIGQLEVHVFNKIISDSIEKFSPDVIFCPFPDRHIDHRLIFESVMVATRPVGFARNISMIAAYETLSETHWNAPYIEPNFVPNWNIDISKFHEKKIEALNCYSSQISPFPSARSIEAAKSLAIFRGSQAGFGYAESFHILRLNRFLNL